MPAIQDAWSRLRADVRAQWAELPALPTGTRPTLGLIFVLCAVAGVSGVALGGRYDALLGGPTSPDPLRAVMRGAHALAADLLVIAGAVLLAQLLVRDARGSWLRWSLSVSLFLTILAAAWTGSILPVTHRSAAALAIAGAPAGASSILRAVLAHWTLAPALLLALLIALRAPRFWLGIPIAGALLLAIGWVFPTSAGVPYDLTAMPPVAPGTAPDWYFLPVAWILSWSERWLAETVMVVAVAGLYAARRWGAG